MKLLKNFFRSDALLIRSNSDRGAVRIRSGYHQHVIALQAMEAGIDICRQIGSGDISYMYVSAGVRPGNCNKNISLHNLLLI